MGVQFWKKVETLFGTCLDLDAEAREALLQEASNRAFAQEVRELLEVLPYADDLFAKPLVPDVQNIIKSVAQSAKTEKQNVFQSAEPGAMNFPEVPDQIGHYQVEQKLGSGGMGVVYLATEASPFRKVAIKVVLPQKSDDTFEARFKTEMQALALMNHHNIASLIHTGTTKEEQSYLVMEYIEGQPLTVYCDKHQLPLKERLKLFVQVCEGVAYAHQSGVIHGDLKPTNILVTEVNDKPQVKLIDFGIARAADPDMQLLLGANTEKLTLGTPAYMPPEGIERIDVRGDVYALGAVLFEMLTGATLLDQAGYTSLTKQGRQAFIRNKQAVKPSDQIMRSGEGLQLANRRTTTPEQLYHAMLQDLDAITVKAMASDPNQRYKAVSELQEDLERYFDNRVVKALEHPTLWLKVRKFVKRRPTLAVVLVMTCVSVLLLFASWTSSYLRIKATRDKALESEQKAIHSLDMLRRTQGFYRDLLTMPHPYHSGRDVTLQEAMRQAESTLPIYAKGEPILEADVRLFMGEVYFALGFNEGAAKQLSKALALRKKHLGNDHAATAEAMDRLARHYRSIDRLDDAERLFRTALAIQESELGTYHQDRMLTLSGLGTVFFARQNYREAARLSMEAHQYLRTQLGPDHRATWNAALNMANALGKMLNFENAIRHLRTVVDSQTKVLGPEHPLTALSKTNLASFLYDDNQLKEAESLLLNVLNINRNAFGPDHETTRSVQHELAKVFIKQVRYEQAEKILAKLIEAYQQDVGTEHPETLRAMVSIATLYHYKKQFKKAIVFYRKIIKRYGRANKMDHTNSLSIMNNLADALNHIGDHEQALEMVTKTLRIKETVMGANNISTLDSMLTKGETLLHLGRNEEALGLIQLANLRMNAHHPEKEGRLLLYKGYLGYALVKMQRPEEGVPLLMESRDGLAGIEGGSGYRTIIEKFIIAIDES